jgi:hypothetical protein
MTKLLRSCALVLTGAASPAWGAEFTPMLEVGVLRTDNVSQVPVDPQAETIWQLIPTFKLEQDTGRFNADAEYRVEYFRYDDLGEDETFNQFDGEFSVAAVPDRFFVNFGGMRAQAIVDPQANIPHNNFVLSANRTDVDEYHLGPSFQVPVGGSAIFSGDLQRAWYRYDETAADVGYNDYTDDTVTLGVDNYAKGSGATWAARYSGEKASYDVQPVPFEQREASLELGLWFSNAARLFVVGGKETPWDNPLDTSLEDSFWEAGVARKSDRLAAELAVGERSFGSSGRASVTFMFDRGDTGLSYSEDPTTTAGDQFRSGGLLEPGQPYDYLSQAGALERYILNRLAWTLNLDLPRVSVAAVIFDEERLDRINVLGEPLGDETQTGASISATWSVGAKLDLVLEARAGDREFANLSADKFEAGSLTANYELGTRTMLIFELQRWQEDSDDDIAGLNYTANALSANVQRTFR